MHRTLVLWTLGIGIALFAINAMATWLYWYTALWWFDMAMHTLGGAFVALVGMMFLKQWLTGLSSRELFITIALFVFIVGLAWEYYEYVVQFYIKSVKLAEVTDSISDLICDMVGGSIAMLFVIALRKRYNHL